MQAVSTGVPAWLLRHRERLQSQSAADLERAAMHCEEENPNHVC